jgi:uncharacterized protein
MCEVEVQQHKPGVGGLPYHVMIKPSGSQCNLDCSYCFYLHKQELLQQPAVPRMSDEVLEAHIRQYIEAQGTGPVVFSWQGGEPTLMGLDFFRKVVTLQAKYKSPGQTIDNDIQTNGVLLNEAWFDFLKEHNFLVGISIDGPEELHDRNRRAKGGQPTFAKVMAAIEQMQQRKVLFNALCVVNRQNARRPIDVYRFLRDSVRPRLMQFIPCVEPKDFASVAPSGDDQSPMIASAAAVPGNAESIVTEWSVDPNDWGYFLCRVWDEWFRKDYGRVFVDYFEDMASQLIGQGPQRCVSSPQCGRALALEHDGGLYSCDHFVYPQYRLGSISETHEGELAGSPQQKKFGTDKSSTLPVYCKQCLYVSHCWGECPKDRIIKAPDGEPGLNYLCSGLKKFYAKVYADKPELLRRMGA